MYALQTIVFPCFRGLSGKSASLNFTWVKQESKRKQEIKIIVMKKIMIIFMLLSVQIGFSQQATLTQKGRKVFVVGVSKSEGAVKTVDRLIDELKDWSYWEVTADKAEADFVLQVDVTASKGITATSWGGTSYALVAQLIDKEDQVFWESPQFRASPNGTNGFNAGNAVVKKLMRILRKNYTP